MCGLVLACVKWLSALASSGLYGIHTVLTCTAVYSVIRRQPGWYRLWASRSLIAILLTIFGLETSFWATCLFVLLKRLRICLIDQNPEAITARIAIANSSTRLLRSVLGLFFNAEFVIGDALIVWHVCTLPEK
ncbi:hypothetical protein BKA62DRAFT_818579 [Auriculariales sp. MPI-PUGE-AT-0066]|nr:hypothetical protein BKA62DRAFT_818579 [Auriculariales sp. MPI-PUGE-AT-0066]